MKIDDEENFNEEISLQNYKMWLIRQFDKYDKNKLLFLGHL